MAGVADQYNKFRDEFQAGNEGRALNEVPGHLQAFPGIISMQVSRWRELPYTTIRLRALNSPPCGDQLIGTLNLLRVLISNQFKNTDNASLG